MKSAVVFGAVGAGVVLLVLGFSWVKLFPGTSTWTPEKAEQWAQVKDRLHNLSFVVHSPNPPRRHGSRAEAEAEYKQLKAVAHQLQSELENATEAPHQTAKTLKWSGIGLLALGVLGNFALKDGG